jgi:hypothetical protein
VSGHGGKFSFGSIGWVYLLLLKRNYRVYIVAVAIVVLGSIVAKEKFCLHTVAIDFCFSRHLTFTIIFSACQISCLEAARKAEACLSQKYANLIQ